MLLQAELEMGTMCHDVHEMLLVVCVFFCWSLPSLRSCSFCIACSCFFLAQIMRNAGHLADAASPFARDFFASLSFVCLCCESMFACAAFRLAGFFQDFDEQGKHFCRCPRSCMLMTARIFCEHPEFVLLFFGNECCFVRFGGFLDHSLDRSASRQ